MTLICSIAILLVPIWHWCTAVVPMVGSIDVPLLLYRWRLFDISVLPLLMVHHHCWCLFGIDVTALMLWPVWKPVRYLPWLTQFGEIVAKRSIVTVTICDCFQPAAGCKYYLFTPVWRAYAMSLMVMGAKINKQVNPEIWLTPQECLL